MKMTRKQRDALVDRANSLGLEAYAIRGVTPEVIFRVPYDFLSFGKDGWLSFSNDIGRGNAHFTDFEEAVAELNKVEKLLKLVESF